MPTRSSNNAQPVKDPVTGNLVAPFPIYRFLDAGWTLGGPIYIPGMLNKNKDKLFGFMSQEWNHNIIPGTLHQITVPTAAQRAGDFSNTRDATGALQTIYRSANSFRGESQRDAIRRTT